MSAPGEIAPPRPRPRVWPVFLTFGLVLPVAGLVTLVAILATVGLGRILSHEANLFSLQALLTASGATELVLVGAVLIAARPLTRARLRLQRGRTTAALVVAAAVGGVALSQVLDTIVELTGLGETGSLPILGQALAGAHGGQLVQALIVIALLAGVAEELFFRGFIQTRLAQRWSARTAVLVTAVCFGVMHADLVHSPLAFCLGLWLGFVCERAGSLWPAIVTHVANNGVATLCAGVRVPLLGTGVALLAVVACTVWLLRSRPRRPLEIPSVDAPGVGAGAAPELPP